MITRMIISETHSTKNCSNPFSSLSLLSRERFLWLCSSLFHSSSLSLCTTESSFPSLPSRNILLTCYVSHSLTSRGSFPGGRPNTAFLFIYQHPHFLSLASRPFSLAKPCLPTAMPTGSPEPPQRAWTMSV